MKRFRSRISLWAAGCWAAALAALALCCIPAAQAQSSPGSSGAPTELVAGRDYQVLSKPMPTTPGRIDVVYFFWYGSPFSSAFDPLIRKWANENAPAVARFQPSPAVLTQGWAYGARVFFALDAMGLERTLGPGLIQAVHSGVVQYADPTSLRSWLLENHVDVLAFSRAINSPKVVAKTASSPAVSRMFGVQAVPCVVINGQFLFSIAPGGDPEELMSRVSFAVRALAQRQLTTPTSRSGSASQPNL